MLQVWWLCNPKANISWVTEQKLLPHKYFLTGLLHGLQQHLEWNIIQQAHRIQRWLQYFVHFLCTGAQLNAIHIHIFHNIALPLHFHCCCRFSWMQRQYTRVSIIWSSALLRFWLFLIHLPLQLWFWSFRGMPWPLSKWTINTPRNMSSQPWDSTATFSFTWTHWVIGFWALDYGTTNQFEMYFTEHHRKSLFVDFAVGRRRPVFNLRVF